MDDLDGILGKLAERPGHARLDGLETRVAARIAADRQNRDLGTGASLAIIVVALGIGVASGQSSIARAAPAPASAALGPGLDLAPSTRLGEAE
jgi:hypothetical protein